MPYTAYRIPHTAAVALGFGFLSSKPDTAMLEHLFPRTADGTLIRIGLWLGWCSRGRPTATKGKRRCRHPLAVAARRSRGRSERGSCGGDGDRNGVALTLTLALALLCREGQRGESWPITAVGAESAVVPLCRRTAPDGTHVTSIGGWGGRGVSHVVRVWLIFAEPALVRVLVLMSRNGGGGGRGAAQIKRPKADATIASRGAARAGVLRGRWGWHLG